jgi:hypothetical protein
MTFTVVGHPEFYSNPTQKHTYTAANQSWTMDLTVTAKITINVKSNVPSGTNLSGATVSYFHQTGTTDSSGNVPIHKNQKLDFLLKKSFEGRIQTISIDVWTD